MPKVSPLQSNFNGGEFSPWAYGRVDSERYREGLKTCLNYVPTRQGGITRRPGTMFVAEVKTSAAKPRLIPFEFSTTQAYMLEFGNEYIRFYKDNGQIVLDSQAITAITNASTAVLTYAGADTYANGDEIYISGIVGPIGTYLNNRNFKVANVTAGSNTLELNYMDGTAVNSTSMGLYTSGGTVEEVYTLASPYITADLFDIKFVQSADTLYLVHPDYAPRKLTRTGHTSWTLTTIDFLDGPYLPTNTTSTTLTPGAATGTGVTLTASAVTGINAGAGFQTTDVGRLIRLKQGSVWGYVKITGRTSTTIVTVDVINTLTTIDAKATWRLGVWSGTTGYPAAVAFHEDRLFFGGPEAYPQRLDGSNSSDYENFAPSATDGTISASNGLSFSLNAEDVNAIKWITSEEKGMLIGTVGSEWVVRPASATEALTPTNIQAKPATKNGSSNLQGMRIGRASVFLQRAKRKIRELTYFYEVDGFQAPDLTEIAEHVTETGIVQMAYQKEPQGIIWCVREDGVLAAMTYERSMDGLRASWHRHIIGGYSDAANSNAVVESVAVIPSPDGTRDEVWLVVRRRINGGTKRYIEYITKFFEDTDDQHEAFYVDTGLSYDLPVTITAATAANPVVVTANSHGLVNGDTVIIRDIIGMTELNGNIYTVANKTANTIELTSNGSNVDGTGFSAWVSGGTVRKRVSTVSGLWHLEGQTVNILGDGAVQPTQTVTNGAITLTTAAGTVHIGLNKSARGEMLRLDAGAADGTALGKTRRVHRVGFLVHRSLGLRIGTNFDEDDMNVVTFRRTSNQLGAAPPLFSGVISETLDADFDFENNICWEQYQPLPSTILAVMPQMVTQDR